MSINNHYVTRVSIVSNKLQLIETIRRSRNGVVLADLKNCYEGIESDCGSMIVGGDIIAVKNKVEFKSLVLYPRGTPFLTKLSGTFLSILISCTKMCVTCVDLPLLVYSLLMSLVVAVCTYHAHASFSSFTRYCNSHTGASAGQNQR